MSVEKTFKGVRLSDEELLVIQNIQEKYGLSNFCLLYTSPSPRD